MEMRDRKKGARKWKEEEAMWDEERRGLRRRKKVIKAQEEEMLKWKQGVPVGFQTLLVTVMILPDVAC